MYNLVNLKGKRIIVTGASSGIGRATAILLSKLEAEVILISRREDKLKEVISELDGTGHKYFCFDFQKTDEIENFIGDLISESSVKFDGLVYSAGMSGTRPFKMMKPDKLMEVMSVNTLSFIELVRCLTKKKSFEKGTSIVGVSSISSIQGNKSKVSYCASKAAMDAAIRAMGKELAPSGIRLNTVNPGIIKTAIYDNLVEGASSQSEDFNSIVNRQYLGLGEPEDVANLIAFLLSDASRFIAGTSIMIDGGRTSS